MEEESHKCTNGRRIHEWEMEYWKVSPQFPGIKILRLTLAGLKRPNSPEEFPKRLS